MENNEENPDVDVRGGVIWKFGRTRTGEGWFENQRCWRTSFVNGPLVFARVARACLCECKAF